MTPAELKEWWEGCPLLERQRFLQADGDELVRITGRTKAYHEMSREDADFWYQWLQGAIVVYGPVVPYQEDDEEDSCEDDVQEGMEDWEDYDPYFEHDPYAGEHVGYSYDRLPWE